MASKPKSKSSDIKVKKKKWVEIISPFFNDSVIGHTHVFELNNALNKPVKINLMSLTNDPRKQNIDILFNTDKIKGDTGVFASVTGLDVQQPSLKKFVRRNKTKVIDSFRCYTGDKKPVVIKPFIITRNKVNNEIASKIRTIVKYNIIERVSKISFEEFISELISGKIQKDLKSAASKTYPLRLVNIYSVKKVNENSGKFTTLEEVSMAINKARLALKRASKKEAELEDDSSEEDDSNKPKGDSKDKSEDKSESEDKKTEDSSEDKSTKDDDSNKK